MKENAADFGVLCDGCDYDIHNFLKNHPGGSNYVKPYREKEVGERMRDTSHSQAAYYLLREFRKGGRDQSKKDDENEDLENLVDWNKPMLSQVGKLGYKYKEWVILPVDRQLRLFGNPILESLTITPWYVVPLVWLPVILFFIIQGTNKYVQITKDSNPFLPSVLNIAMGVFLWTFLEYSLHRWVFHMEPSGKSQITVYLHFAIHGLHHKVPFDSRRLVFPPLPAAVILYLLYQPLSLIVPESRVIHILAGGILGYVIYDMIHFYLHYGSPSEQSYFYNLKRYHNQHHFAHHDSAFGISSMLWDKVFGTAIHLKKLAVSIKW